MRNWFKILTLLVTGLIVLDSCSNNQVSDATSSSQETETEMVPSTDINYLEVGKDLAMKTKSILGQHLATAIGEKGTEGAVEFCNIKAIPITDSMSVLLDAKIRRVSDKPRNQFNMANEAEMAYIKKWKEAKANGTEQPPIVTELDGQIVGYYPIITNQMCMQCHGQVDTDMTAVTIKKIKKLYPADQATGYGENELRGLFVVEMNKK